MMAAVTIKRVADAEEKIIKWLTTGPVSTISL
jgi:hypothetical protein